MIEGKYKAIVPDPVNEPDGARELYNLEQDPLERNNLAEAEPDALKKMQTMLDDWWNP